MLCKSSRPSFHVDDENVTAEGGDYPYLKVENRAMKNVDSRCIYDARHRLSSFI